MIINRQESGKEMYKLILMDYNMPICNGAESTKMIRNYLAQLQVPYTRPYIVCTTIRNTMAIKREGLSSGVDNFVSKPIFR